MPELTEQPGEDSDSTVDLIDIGTEQVADAHDCRHEQPTPSDGADRQSTESVEIGIIALEDAVATLPSGERGPVIHIFGRRRNGALQHVALTGFRPRFYVNATALGPAPSESYSQIVDTERVTDQSQCYQNIDGEQVVKVFTNHSRDVDILKKRFSNHYQADVPYIDQFLIEHDIKSGVRVEAREEGETLWADVEDIEPVAFTPSPRTQFVDVDTRDDGRDGASDAGIDNITTFDTRSHEYRVWTLESAQTDADDTSLETVQSGIPIGRRLTPDASLTVSACETERQLLTSYLEYLDATDPDILCQWAGEDGALPKLVDRIETLPDDGDPEVPQVTELSRLNGPSQDITGGSIPGRIVFDFLEGFKRSQRADFDSYRIENVVASELELSGSKTKRLATLVRGNDDDRPEDGPAWRPSFARVYACVALEQTHEIIAWWNEFRGYIGCRFGQALYPGKSADMFLLRSSNDSVALPSKGQQASGGSGFQGGEVLEPPCDDFRNVAVLDLKSMYPMLMCTVNASPETKVDPSEFDGPTYETPTGVQFRKDQDGIFREMVTTLLTERDAKKEARDQHDPGSEAYQRYDRQQSCIKILMSSIFGVSGWDRFRLYDAEISRAITAAGRECLRHTAAVAAELGYEVIYGDTDAIAIALERSGIDTTTPATEPLAEHAPGLVDEQGEVLPEAIADDIPQGIEATPQEVLSALSHGYRAAELITDSYSQFAESELNAESHSLELEFETLYHRYFQAGKKKRYAGHAIWHTGEFVDRIKITGFETNRSDVSSLTKEVVRKVLELWLREHSPDAVKDYLLDVLNDCGPEGDIDYDAVAIPQGIRKPLDEYDQTTAHIRGARNANAVLGTSLGEGDKPKRVYLSRLSEQSKRAIEERYRKSGQEMSEAEREALREFLAKPDIICYSHPEQLPEGFRLDWETMIRQSLKKPVSRLLEPIPLEWDEIETEWRARRLGIGEFTIDELD